MKRHLHRTAALLLAAGLTLSACGSGDDDPEAPESAATSSAPTDAPEAPGDDESAEGGEGDESAEPAVPGEVVATNALQAFQCAPHEDGSWTATGTLKNSGEKAVDYQVTVFVGVGNAGEGRMAEVTKVGPDSVKNFAIGSLPAAGDNAVCSVKVIEAD